MEAIKPPRKQNQMIAQSYNYPMSGGYAETVATLADGRVMTVDTQYSCVLAHGNHAKNCDQINKMGGRCNCGLLAGIDLPALVIEAREHGKFGRPEVAPVAKIEEIESPASKRFTRWMESGEGEL